MTHRFLQRAVVAAGTACALLSAAGLADETANLTVTAVVAPSCQLNSVADVDFGVLDPLNDNTAQGTITWVCTNGHNTDVTLNGGSSGNINARAMGGPASLPYQLYTDAGFNNVFGDGVTGDAVAVSGIGYSSPQNITVYGRVLQADAEDALNGNYSDTVVVTIAF